MAARCNWNETSACGQKWAARGMVGMKLTHGQILYIKALQSIANVRAVDCMANEHTITYLVRPAQMGLAIGKNGETVKKIREKIGKNVEVFEYAKQPEDFLKRAFRNVSFGEVSIVSKGKKKEITLVLDSTNKRKLLQNPGRLKKVREIANKTYDVESVRIK